MLFEGQLEVDVRVLCAQGIEQPVHHVGDLAPADVVALVGQTPGQGQVAEGRELPEDEDDLGQVHDALPDAERYGQPLERLEPRELDHLVRGEATVSQHCLGLHLDI